MAKKFDVEVFAQRVDELLREQGMSKTDLANASGVERSYFSNIASGRTSNPTIGTIEAIADALNTTPAYLLGWTEHPGFIIQGIEDLPPWVSKVVDQLLTLPEMKQMLVYYLVLGVKMSHTEERKIIDAELRGSSGMLKALSENDRHLSEFFQIMGYPEGTADQWKLLIGE